MFQNLFKLIINLIATLIQLILLPFNIAISEAFPTISDNVLTITSTLSGILKNVQWALSLVPIPVLQALTLIVGFEIAKHSIYVFSHMLIKVWEVIQKIKFW